MLHYYEKRRIELKEWLDLDLKVFTFNSEKESFLEKLKFTYMINHDTMKMEKIKLERFANFKIIQSYS